MKFAASIRPGILVLAGALALTLSASAQQTAQSDVRLQSYSAARETSLQGTVVRFETSSSSFPMGAHLFLQTSSGQVDVHIGNAKILKAGNLELNAGDSVRIVGEDLVVGSNTFFAARVVQKGTQAVAVRTTKGFLMRPGVGNSPSQTAALRGVR